MTNSTNQPDAESRFRSKLYELEAASAPSAEEQAQLDQFAVHMMAIYDLVFRMSLPVQDKVIVDGVHVPIGHTTHDAIQTVVAVGGRQLFITPSDPPANGHLGRARIVSPRLAYAAFLELAADGACVLFTDKGQGSGAAMSQAPFTEEEFFGLLEDML